MRVISSSFAINGCDRIAFANSHPVSTLCAAASTAP